MTSLAAPPVSSSALNWNQPNTLLEGLFAFKVPKKDTSRCGAQSVELPMNDENFIFPYPPRVFRWSLTFLTSSFPVFEIFTVNDPESPTSHFAPYWLDGWRLSILHLM